MTAPAERPDRIDHDRLFKELLTTFFADFVTLFLPDLADYLDADSVTFLDKEVFTDVTAGEEHVADIVARARFRTTPNGGSAEAFFLVHVENQAKAQTEFGRRMFGYWARLYEKHGLPVYPVALFSYDAPLRAEPDAFTVAFPDLEVLAFRFRVVQLNRLSWRDYVDRPNPVASALMAKMRIAPEERWRVKLECLRLLATLRLDRARMRLISGFVDTYLRLNREEREQFEEAITVEGLREEETIMEIVTSWMEEGIEKGLKQGLQQGLQQGREDTLRATARRQLRKRFGELPAAAAVAVDALPVEGLEDLTEALLDFAAPSDFDAWLAARRAA